MKSAMGNPQVVTQYLESECRAGRVVGPLSIEEFPFVHISRFGVIPKSTPEKWRLIVDMSSPEGGSITGDYVFPFLCYGEGRNSRDSQLRDWGTSN